MSVEFELRSLDQLFESGFIQEVEYHARRAQLLQANPVSSFQPGHFTVLVGQSEPEAVVVKETNSEALPPQPVAHIAQQGVKPEQRQRVLPKQGPTAIPSQRKAMALPQGKYANPFVADRDYEKQASPVVYTSLKGWIKEKDNLGRPDEPTQAIKANWEKLQSDYAAQVVLTNRHDWSLDEGAPNRVKLVGGLDISFARGNKIDAVVCLAVCSYPSMKVVFEAYKMIKLTAPYIPGYLNFREVPYYEDLLEEVRINHPEFLPQVILVDGNGIIHPRACGCACQLAVVTGIPCVGVAKNLLVIDGISDDKIEAAFRQTGSKTVNIVGKTGKVHGQAFKYSSNVEPVYISAGHNIDLATSMALCIACSSSRFPEPVNQADLLGRLWLNKNYNKL